MIEYRILQEQEIDRDIFRFFIRRQVVTACLRRENGAWVVRSDTAQYNQKHVAEEPYDCQMEYVL